MMQHPQHRRKGISAASLLLPMLLLIFMVFLTDAASAQENVPKPMGTCTTDPSFDIPPSTAISDVAQGISNAITTLASSTFDNLSATVPVTAAGALFVFIYGVLFMFGAVAVTRWEATVRVTKLAIVMAVASAGSNGEIFNLMHSLFELGTNDLINSVVGLMTGVPSGGAPPLSSIDTLASKVISAKMIVTVIAAITTGPYGLILGLLILLSVKSLIQAILNAAWIYLMSMVVRALMYGVAPLFIPCLLFERTKHAFDGWLNQLVNASLQPIFLFTFFSFFVALTSDMVDQMLAVPVCWSPMSDTARGTPLLVFGWRFTVLVNGNYELYSGNWGEYGVAGMQFPIPVSTVLIFFVLAELASRFNHIVLAVAGGIASASTKFSDMRGMFTNWNEGGIGQREAEALTGKSHSGAPSPTLSARGQAQAGVGIRR